MSSSTSPKTSDDATASAKTEDEARAADTTGDADTNDRAASPRAEAGARETDSERDHTEPARSASGGGTKLEKSADENGVSGASDEGGEVGRADADAAEALEETHAREDTYARASNPLEDEPEEDEPLDLRALFASDEPEFADPTDTFELARGAKPEPRSGSSEHSFSDLSDEDTKPDTDEDTPFDLPAEAVASEPSLPNAPAPSMGLTGLGGDGAHHGASGNAFASAPGDPLADAVQSALRSVYGEDDHDAHHHYTSDNRNSSSGPILQWAGANVSNDEPAQQDDFELEPIDAQADTAAIDEETTEAVLSYLYEHVGSEEADETPSRGKSAALNETFEARDRLDQPTEDAWAAMAQHRQTVAPTGGAAEYETAEPTALDASPSSESSRPQDLTRPEVTETFYPPVDIGTMDTEASGKLLGAAGLGLIGGIAAAGVAAVFVFNSFVTQQDPTSAQQPTSARLSEAPADGNGENTATATPEPSGSIPSERSQTAAATPQLDPPAGAPTATSSTTEAANPLINASAVSGLANQPIPLDLSVADSESDRFIRITGLPDGVKLSAGIDTGNGSWLLSASRSGDLTLSAPTEFADSFVLDAQLLGEDARTALSEPVSFRVEISGAQVAEAAETRTAAIGPETSPQQTTPSASPVQRAQSLLRAGDVQAAREILRAETQVGSAQAALALGASYDPRTFTGLSSPNANPDATEAFRWYQRAVELGNPNGNSQINELKAWLLR